MSLPIPFAPSSTATVGKTVKVTANATPTSVPGSIPAAGMGASVVLTNAGTVLTFVRLSAEATPVATAADYPLLPGSQVALTMPTPPATGIVGVAVLSSTTTAADVYFTPGEGQ